jgi:general secretion pathway protein I
MSGRTQRGFTLVEVLVALMVVALSLAALMSSVSSAARGSEYLRDKTIAQWIAMNRIVEARLNIQKFGGSGDKGEVDFANRKWRFDTRYFDTDNPTIRRVVVRVWPAGAKADAGPLSESASFLGQALTLAGATQVDWTVVNTTPGAGPNPPGGTPTPPVRNGTTATQ